MTRPTIRDVAAQAGVSTATVSYVLNGTGSVSEATAERVRQCVDRLGYRANSLAVAHRTGRSRTIGLALPDLANPYHSAFAQGVHRAATDHGFSIFLLDGHNSTDEEARGIEMLSDRVPDGLIFCPVREDLMDATDFAYPTVVVDHHAPGFDSVSADIRHGGELQGDLVVEFGHTKIGVITGPEYSETARIRRDGLLARLPDSVEVAWLRPLDFVMDLPIDMTGVLVESAVTCVVTGNDLQAIGLLQQCRNEGIAVPEHVSVIGFDDIGFAGIVNPGLTTIHLPQHDLGRTAFELLAERMTDPDRPPQSVRLDVDVRRRDSLRRLDVER